MTTERELDIVIRAFEQGDGATIRQCGKEILDALRELRKLRKKAKP